MYADRDIYAYARCLNDERIVIVINSAKGSKKVDISLSQLGAQKIHPAILFGEGSVREEGQMIKVKLSARSGVVLKI
jgi:hypothetical protein